MELSDGTTGYLILVNDSSKTIEAFHFNAIVRNARWTHGWNYLG